MLEKNSSPNEILEVVSGIVKRSLVLLARDEIMRDYLRRLARHLLQLTESAAEPEGEEADSVAAAPPLQFRPQPREVVTMTPQMAQEVERAIQDRQGGAAASTNATTNQYPHGDDDDLTMIIERCRLKAEACRWLAERPGTPEQSDSMVELAQHRDLIQRARDLPNCYLWMMKAPSLARETLPDLANCFLAVAEACSLADLATQIQARQPRAATC